LKTVAEFAVRRRWFVILGWLVLVVAAQGIAGAMGGSAYKDTFSLPHTETASVANLLKDAGLDNQNGVSGTVVLKNKKTPPSPPRPAA
jgi:RND superfamily putative drug exporter